MTSENLTICITQLSTPFGSKPQSRVCEPVFPLCRPGSFVSSLVAAAFFLFQPTHVAVEGRSNVVLNMHARLQISLPTRFFSLLHQASQCAFGDAMHQLLVQQFFSLFAQIKTTTKSHENYVFLYPFSSMAISP